MRIWPGGISPSMPWPTMSGRASWMTSAAWRIWRRSRSAPWGIRSTVFRRMHFVCCGPSAFPPSWTSASRRKPWRPFRRWRPICRRSPRSGLRRSSRSSCCRSIRSVCSWCLTRALHPLWRRIFRSFRHCRDLRGTFRRRRACAGACCCGSCRRTQSGSCGS